MFGFRGLEGAGQELAEQCYREIIERESKPKDKSILFSYPRKTSIFENLGGQKTMSMSKEQYKARYAELMTKTVEMIKVAEELKGEENTRLTEATKDMQPIEARQFIRDNKNPLADGEVAMTAVLPVAMIKMMLLSAEYLGISAEELKALNVKKD